MRTQLGLLVATYLMFTLSSCAQQVSLDGKLFIIEWYDSNNPEESRTDTLVFSNGQLDCMGTHTWGFSAGAYTCSEKNKVVDFKSTLNSPSEGSTTWTGKVEGEKVSGEFYWPKEKMTFKFEGELKS